MNKSTMIFNEIATVVSNTKLADNIFEAILISPKISNVAKPGQFVNILPSKNWLNVMRRPMSIAWQKNRKISIIYKIFGEGTKIISMWKNDDKIDIIGPLGNCWDNNFKNTPILIGGGVGIAPILNLHLLLEAKKIKHILVMGARNRKEHFIKHNPENNIYLSTDLDDYGLKGNVIDAVKIILEQTKEKIKIYSCGPPGMMEAVKNYAILHNIECDLALETIMACGIGICQGCTVIKKTNCSDSYRERYALACIDGPIFNVKELDNGIS